MPTYKVKVGASTYRVDAPDENTAWQWANYTHDQSATQEAPVAPTPTESGGFFGSLGSAFQERATTALPTAKIFTGLGDQKAAVDELAKHKEEANSAYKNTEFGEIGDAFRQGNFTQALGKTVDKFKEVAGSSLGSMAPAMVAGAGTAAAVAASPLAIPAAAAGTAAFGLISLGSYLSDNISRQKEEQAAAGKPYEDINRLKGVTAATISTSLDLFGFKFFKPLGRLVGVEGKAAAEKTAMEIVAKATQPRAYARAVAQGTAQGIAFEVPQEVTQSVLERWQAGLALDPFTDPSAAKEYLEAAGGALLLGGPMGAYSKLRDTAAARGTPEGQALLRTEGSKITRDIEREPDATEPISAPDRAGTTVAGQPDTGAPAAGTAGTQRTGVDVSGQTTPGTTAGEAGKPGALTTPVASKDTVRYQEPPADNTVMYTPEVVVENNLYTASKTGSEATIEFKQPHVAANFSIDTTTVKADGTYFRGTSNTGAKVKLSVDKNYLELESDKGGFLRLSRTDRKNETLIRKLIGDAAVDTFLAAPPNTTEQQVTSALLGEDYSPTLGKLNNLFDAKYAAPTGQTQDAGPPPPPPPVAPVTLSTMQPGQQVTLYRGENNENVAGGQWWTTDPDKAAKFGKVTSVTLPAEVIGQNAAQGHAGSTEFVFPTEGKRPLDLAKTTPPPTPSLTDEEVQAASADAKEAYDDARDHLSALLKLPSRTESQDYMLGRLRTDLTQIDYQRYLADTIDDKPLADVVDGITVKLASNKKAPRAMQGEMFSTNKQIGRAITGAMALAGQDPVKAAQELENRKQRVMDYKHSDAEVMRLGRSADMNAAQSMANRDALVAAAKKRTLETIDQAIAGLPSVGQPRAMQGDLFNRKELAQKDKYSTDVTNLSGEERAKILTNLLQETEAKLKASQEQLAELQKINAAAVAGKGATVTVEKLTAAREQVDSYSRQRAALQNDLEKLNAQLALPADQRTDTNAGWLRGEPEKPKIPRKPKESMADAPVQESLFGGEKQKTATGGTKESADLEKTLMGLLLGEDPRQDFGAEEEGADPETEAIEQKLESQKETELAPKTSTYHINDTQEGKLVNRFFDALVSSTGTPGEVDKHTALKDVVRKDVLSYDIVKPGETKSLGLREALNYIGSLVGGRDKLNAMIEQLEQNKSPSVQQAIFNRFGLPNLTSRRGLEGFASRVGKELEELPIMRKQTGEERTGVQVSTKTLPAPATGGFKGVIPYTSEIEATSIKAKERGPNQEGVPREPSLKETEKKRFVVQDTKLRTAWRTIKQMIAARGAPSAEQLAAKNYMENPGRETFGDALNDLAYDIATGEGANTLFYGEGGQYAVAFEKWINDNLDQSTVDILNDLVAVHKLNIAETDKYNAARSKYRAELKVFAEKKRVAAQAGAGNKIAKAPSKEPNISKQIEETEAGEQEDLPAEKFKRSLETIHPAVLRMVEKGNLTGALETLADAEKGYFKVLAERLLAAKPTAKLEIINRNKILSLSNDPNVKEALKNQIAMLVKMVETSIPTERQGVMVRNLKSDNLQAVMTEVKNLQKNFTNDSQREIAKQAHDFLDKQYGWIGKYDPESDTIMLRDTTISNHTFLHEVLHAVTSDLIENADKLRGVRKAAYNRLEELYKYASGMLAAQNSKTTAYGLQDLHEFISEAMTNPVFQADLRALRYKAAPFSLWDAFSRAIAQLFRMDLKSKDSDVMVEVMRATNILIPGEASLEGVETSKFLGAEIDEKGAYIPSTKKDENPIATAGFKTLRAGNDFSEKLVGATFITGMNVADRSKGAGTKLLRAITGWADTKKKTLVLVAAASPDGSLGGLSQKQLKEWYVRNGFEDRGDYMVRAPSKEARKLEPRAIAGRIAAVPAGMQNTPSTLKQLTKSRTWAEAQEPYSQLVVSAKAASRPALLGALTLRQIGDLVRNRVPQVNNFIRLTEEFLARKNNILKESGDILNVWERMQSSNPGESVALAKVMHEATIIQFDPDKIRYGRDPREIMVVEEWKKLSLTSKNIYRQVRNFYEKRQDEYRAIMRERITAMSGIVVSKEAVAEMRNSGVPESTISRLTKSGVSEVEMTEMKNLGVSPDTIIAMRKSGISEATMLKIREEFENTTFKGPYFPLMRHGRFWYQFGTGATREYYKFETAGAKEAHMAERIERNRLQNKPDVPIMEGSEYAQQMDLHAKQSNFLRTVFDAVDSSKYGTDAAQNLKDTIYQNFLAIQPESSFRKQFMHRNNVAGYSEDALRNFAKSSFHMAYQIARFEHSPDMFSQVQAARMQIKDRKDEAGGFDKELSRENNELSDYVTEMDKRLTLMLNPTDVGTIPSLLSNIGFIWYLTAPASAIVNIVGGMVIGLPTLIGQNVRMNPGKSYTKATLEALGQMKTAAGQIMATGFEVETGKRVRDFRLQFPTLSRSDSMTDVDKRAYERFVADGVIDITAAYDQSGLAAAPTESYGGVKNRAMEALTALFHNAERFNREVMAMSSFRAAMEKRKGYADQNLAFVEAVADAKDVTQRSMFDYSSANKPRYFQNPVARVVLQFKQFPQQMTFFLTHNAINMFKGMDAPTRREARARFVGTMGMAAIMAGGTGIWGFSTVASIINAVVNGLKDDDDEEMFDFELEFVNWAVETFGANMGTLITRGAANALTGLDVASRVKLDDMWFRDSRKNQDEVEALQTFLVDLLGPTAGLLVNVAEARKLWNEGHGDRALEMMAPAFIKNPLVAARYGSEGVNTLGGDPLMEDVSPFHLMAQSLGLRSAELSEIQFYNTNIKGQEQAILKQRQNLLNLYALAFMSNDSDTLDKAYDNIDKFNSKHPSVSIAAGTLTKSIKGHLEKSSEMDHGLYLDKKLRGVLDNHSYIDKIRQ